MKIKVLVGRVDQPVVVEEIDNTLEAMQALVDGQLEHITIRSRIDGDASIDLWFNEEGRLIELPFNRYVGDFDILGTFFLSSHNADGDATSLPDEDIARLIQHFNEYDVFCGRVAETGTEP